MLPLGMNRRSVCASADRPAHPGGGSAFRVVAGNSHWRMAGRAHSMRRVECRGLARRPGGWRVSSSRHGHQRETQRRARLNEAGEQQGDAGAHGPLIETEKPSQGTGLRICDRTRHGRGGEFCTTGHQLGFQALCGLGGRQLLAQTQHGRTRRTVVLEGQVGALAAAPPDVQGHSCRGQLGLDYTGGSMRGTAAPAACGMACKS